MSVIMSLLMPVFFLAMLGFFVFCAMMFFREKNYFSGILALAMILYFAFLSSFVLESWRLVL